MPLDLAMGDFKERGAEQGLALCYVCNTNLTPPRDVNMDLYQ